ncbi:uncharacterized protein LOC123317199 [Coccinella septempunctata]|uniref:uncharacterized protein LOC123317199 n=1 Tax=Coccinella septempunctata TaxID=41139 RepID=UPI001D08AD1E|nr:uncharacterized protein LOC123317199 [Coccinella septempunctata]
MPGHLDQDISQLLVRNLRTIRVVHRITSFCASLIMLSSRPSFKVFSTRCVSTRPLVVMMRGRILVHSLLEEHNVRTIVWNGPVCYEWLVPVQLHLLILQDLFWYALVGMT